MKKHSLIALGVAVAVFALLSIAPVLAQDATSLAPIELTVAADAGTAADLATEVTAPAAEQGGFLAWILGNGDALLTALASIVAGASILANFTKTDRDNKAIGFIGNILHALAFNFKNVGGDGRKT